MREFSNKYLKHILIFFIAIQPFLELKYLYDDAVTSVFFVSPATIIRLMLVFIMLILVLFTIDFNKKYYLFIVYLAMILGFTIAHHLNALSFTSYVPGNFGYSSLQELFYISRMCVPLTLIFITYHVRITFEDIKKIAFYLTIFTCGSIIVSNLLTIGYTSYTQEPLKYNIFQWTDSSLTFYETASVGFFQFANRVSALLSVIMILNLTVFIKQNTFKNYSLVLMAIVSSIMVGTKVASFGIIILLVIMFIIYLFMALIKREFVYSHKTALFLILALCLALALLVYSPAVNRINITEDVLDNAEENDDKTLEDSLIAELESEFSTDEEHNKQLIIEFIDENNDFFGVNVHFLTVSYPYIYDPYFWLDIYKQPLYMRMNYRHLEKSMLDRVKAVNNNSNDNLLGITYIREQNIFPLERDFLQHYYSIGIIGVMLLLMPYVILSFISGVYILFTYKSNFNLYNISLLLVIGFVLCIAIYSGNIMDGLSVTLVLALLIGNLLRRLFYKTVECDKKVSIIIPTYNDSSSICETFDSILMQTFKNIEVIIVDDGSSDDTKNIVNDYILKNNATNFNYVYQDNKDQLNAVKNGLKYATGDYIYILHSDDLLYNSGSIKSCVLYLESNNEYDAITFDIAIIDEKSKFKTIQTVDYFNNKYTLPISLVWLGRNLFSDVAFYKREVFENEVFNNYLTNNTPYWVDLNSMKMLNVKKVDFFVMKYRVHENNYINNEIGKLNVINGELRFLTSLMKYYNINDYDKEYTKQRIYNKLSILKYYKPKYELTVTKDKAHVINFVLNKRFTEKEIKSNVYLDSIQSFYEKVDSTKREITITEDVSNKVYDGCDVRLFNKKLLNKELPSIYLNLMKEMKRGFNVIYVTKENKEDIIRICRFLNIINFIEIKEKL